MARFNEARADKERALADLRQMEVERERGDTTSTAAARDEWLAMIGIARGRFLAMAARLEPELTGQMDSKVVGATLRNAIHETLREVAGDVRSGDLS